MVRKFAKSAGVAVLAAVCTTAPGAATADEEGTVKYRQAIMKANSGHAGALALIAKGQVPFKDQMAGHAHALHELSKQVTMAFKERVLAGKTKAKAYIWEEWPEFEEKAEDLEKATGGLSAAAASGDMDAFGKSLKATFDACKGCHEDFRKK